MHRILYLGLEVPPHLQTKEVVHHPIIKIVPRQISDPLIQSSFTNFKSYTHLIFTSRQAISIFFEFAQSFAISKEEIQSKRMISIGQRTAAKLQEYGLSPIFTAQEETAEGVIRVLEDINLKDQYLFLPQSSLSRSLIANWLGDRCFKHVCCPLYDTLPDLTNPIPDLTLFHEIVFTSSSTVDAFLKTYPSLPVDKKITAIGPITKQYLLSKNNLLTISSLNT